MSQSVEVIYYDGHRSTPHAAHLFALTADSVELRTDSKRYYYNYADMELIGALGQINPVVELPNEVRIEFKQKQLPDWFNINSKKKWAWLWNFEKSPKLILISLLVVIIVVAATVRFGIPFAAHQIAFNLPEDSLDRLGPRVEIQINAETKPSQLSAARQQQIRQLYIKHVATDDPAKISFRQSELYGANALALPNNQIILTDELVQIIEDDREIIAVLAHEQGHLVHRHNLQQLISAIGVSVLFSYITGDISDLISSLPAALVAQNYSRNFEQQADDYAINLLKQQQIPIEYFADFLTRIKTENDNNSFEELLSSHPATSKRIDHIHQSKVQSKPIQ